MHRFLIDECMSVRLASELHARGHEAYHVVHRGLGGMKDTDLRTFLLKHDAILVTNNAKDFRKLYGDSEVHPGLILVVPNAPFARQLVLLEAALQVMGNPEEMVNRVIEVHAESDVRSYDWPPP